MPEAKAGIVIDRRSLLASAVMLVGGSLAGGLPTQLLAASTRAAPIFFAAPQFAMLDEIAEIVIPRTDTPGAREVGVAGFVDALMAHWASSENRREIAGESRSMHASQGMGAGQPKGEASASFDFIAGERVTGDLFADIDTSWGRVEGGERVGDLLAQALGRYEPTHPEAILPQLLDAYHELEKLDGDWPARKKPELLHAIELAAGLYLDATAERWDVASASANATCWRSPRRRSASRRTI